ILARCRKYLHPSPLPYVNFDRGLLKSGATMAELKRCFAMWKKMIDHYPNDPILKEEMLKFQQFKDYLNMSPLPRMILPHDVNYRNQLSLLLGQFAPPQFYPRRESGTAVRTPVGNYIRNKRTYLDTCLNLL